jgi:uncharacterized membrane protein YfbV (UPF0208 family)
MKKRVISHSHVGELLCQQVASSTVCTQLTFRNWDLKVKVVVALTRLQVFIFHLA